MKDPEKPSKKFINPDKYLKYSGIVFQLFFLLLIAVYGGQKLDDYLGNKDPWIMLTLIMLFFAGWMYKLVLDLKKDENEK